MVCQNINKFPVHLTSSRPLLVNVNQWLNRYLIIVLLFTFTSGNHAHFPLSNQVLMDESKPRPSLYDVTFM